MSLAMYVVEQRPTLLRRRHDVGKAVVREGDGLTPPSFALFGADRRLIYPCPDRESRTTTVRPPRQINARPPDSYFAAAGAFFVSWPLESCAVKTVSESGLRNILTASPDLFLASTMNASGVTFTSV